MFVVWRGSTSAWCVALGMMCLACGLVELVFADLDLSSVVESVVQRVSVCGGCGLGWFGGGVVLCGGVTVFFAPMAFAVANVEEVCKRRVVRCAV